MAERTPVYFISHGAPTLALDETDPTHRFLRDLGKSLKTPSAALVVSAHWEANVPSLGAVEHPETIYDFYGFPQALYQIRYPAPGSPSLARKAAQLLEQSGLKVKVDEQRGLDHGAWIPLMLMYPAADVPVVQLSVQVAEGPHHHYALGQALRPLRDEGVLIICSGSLTHNLGEADLHWAEKTLPAWVEEFRSWVQSTVEHGRTEELLDYENRAPHARRNHPRDEHFLPLFVAIGASDRGERVHADAAYRTLAMDAYKFS